MHSLMRKKCMKINHYFFYPMTWCNQRWLSENFPHLVGSIKNVEKILFYFGFHGFFTPVPPRQRHLTPNLRNTYLKKETEIPTSP